MGWTLLTTYLGMASNFLVYIYFSVVFDRVLANAVVFGALLVVWGASGTVTNVALARVLDRVSARHTVRRLAVPVQQDEPSHTETPHREHP